jgi:hypothetical protein
MGNDVCFFNLATLSRVIPRIWHALVVGIGLLQFHATGIELKKEESFVQCDKPTLAIGMTNPNHK